MRQNTAPELGILNLALMPSGNLRFRVSPARSLHAAILRRLELIAPEISKSLHDSLPGSPSTERPLTVSSLLGIVDGREDGPTATEGQTYRARVTTLTPEVARKLDLAFHPRHPLGREPLVLEHVPFQVVLEETYWDNLATYASLLTMAKPRPVVTLEFCSPTAFRTQAKSPVMPDPTICISGYLRKWNAFSQIPLPVEPLMAYIRNYMRLSATSIHPAVQRLGKFSEYGFLGRVEWQAEGGPSAILRQVNALVDFAGYCGTGAKTAMGMGQTRRITNARSLPRGTGGKRCNHQWLKQ